MQRAAGGRTIDPARQLAVLGRDRLVVAVGDGPLEAARQSLHRGPVAKVLQTLLGGDPDALFLLLDVRHDVKTPAARAQAMVAEQKQSS